MATNAGDATTSAGDATTSAGDLFPAYLLMRTLQKVRKRQCQMEVSAEKDHHGSHCDHPGPQKPTENDNFAITLQKVRKRQCQMEVSAGKDHHGSHCDIPGLQNAPIVSTPLSYIRKSTRIPREQCGGSLSWNPVGPSTRPGYPQCVRSCQGAQNLSRFARFPFLRKAGRYDQHAGKFIVINRNGGPNGQLSRNIENPTNP